MIKVFSKHRIRNKLRYFKKTQTNVKEGSPTLQKFLCKFEG